MVADEFVSLRDEFVGSQVVFEGLDKRTLLVEPKIRVRNVLVANRQKLVTWSIKLLYYFVENGLIVSSESDVIDRPKLIWFGNSVWDFYAELVLYSNPICAYPRVARL